MDSWPLEPGAREAPIGLTQATALLAQVGTLAPTALAGVMLDVLAPRVPLAQCAVFVNPPDQPPRIVSYANRARTRNLPAVRRGQISPTRQTTGEPRPDVGRPGCAEPVRISERIALLSCVDQGNRLSINFYRGREHGPFTAVERACIEALGPFLTQLARLHLRFHQYDHELGPTLIRRLRLRFPALTRRDIDLLAGVVDGDDSEAIARRMGIQPASVQTYLKRLYRKLGISGQRELFGVMLAPWDPLAP